MYWLYCISRILILKFETSFQNNANILLYKGFPWEVNKQNEMKKRQQISSEMYFQNLLNWCISWVYTKENHYIPTSIIHKLIYYFSIFKLDFLCKKTKSLLDSYTWYFTYRNFQYQLSTPTYIFSTLNKALGGYLWCRSAFFFHRNLWIASDVMVSANHRSLLLTKGPLTLPFSKINTYNQQLPNNSTLILPIICQI